MVGYVHIRFEARRPPYVSVRRYRQIMRDAHREMGSAWHRHMLPLHFRQPAAGGGLYGYQARKPDYVHRKGRGARRSRRHRIGSRRPAADAGRYALVYTGLTRQKVLMSRPMIRAFPTRVRISMPVPSYVRMQPYRSGRPALGKEIIAVTESEKRTLRKRLKKVVQQRFNQARTGARKTTTIR